MLDDPRVDVGGHDLEIVGAREAEREQRIDHRPWLIALRRTDLDQPGSRREIETRPDEDWGVKFRDRYRGKAGAPLAISVTRGGRALNLSTQVRERSLVSFTLTPAPSPSPKQVKIWRGLATGSTGN